MLGFFSSRRRLWIFLIVCLFLFLSLSLYQHSILVSEPRKLLIFKTSIQTKPLEQVNKKDTDLKSPITTIRNYKTQMLNNEEYISENSDEEQPFNQHVHIFYYAWYRNIKHDNKYEHWNHKVLPHWTKSTNDKYANLIDKSHDPDRYELATNFYPSRGPYSSIDRSVVMEHFLEIKKQTGIHVVVLSWWGINEADENGSNVDIITPFLLSCAEEVGIKVMFHMEPYKKRTAQSVKKDIQYVIDTYGSSAAFYRYNGRPMFYIYDSYLIDSSQWKQVLGKGFTDTIRGTKYDSIFIGRFSIVEFFDHLHTWQVCISILEWDSNL